MGRHRAQSQDLGELTPSREMAGLQLLNAQAAGGCAAPQGPQGLSAPRGTADLFWSFSIIALQGFGGVVSVLQRELVDKRGWLTNEAFVEDWAAAQVMPGPNACNLALIFGDRHFGVRGALAALAGMITFPLLLVLVLAMLYDRFSDHAPVSGALRGMGAAAAGLIAGTGLRLLLALRTHPLGAWQGMALAVASLLCAAWMRLPLYAVVFGVGGIAYVLTWRHLRAARSA